MFSKEHQNLKETLQKAIGKISFIIDGWTSPNQIQFQGIIVRWINEDFMYEERVLDLDILHGSHTGNALAELFVKVLEEFKLLDKILSITSDNANVILSSKNCQNCWRKKA